MDSLMNTIKTAAAGTTMEGDPKKVIPDQSSASEIMSSAKLVAEASKYATSNQTDKIDKPKTVGATADIIDATEKYGNNDETKGVGPYLKNARDYLHDYEKSGAKPQPMPDHTTRKQSSEFSISGNHSQPSPTDM
ncbi:hypothetical protein L6452_21115 [Arctium lappa]|uniref:Uncharacterized protein n=1 Tax=Arctium lappa TaxID=4217 RepID=A0ACB9BCF3_ARCLA|nr:hypothetical protein L6452_21115 [Arctium lappa]